MNKMDKHQQSDINFEEPRLAPNKSGQLELKDMAYEKGPPSSDAEKGPDT